MWDKLRIISMTIIWFCQITQVSTIPSILVDPMRRFFFDKITKKTYSNCQSLTELILHCGENRAGYRTKILLLNQFLLTAITLPFLGGKKNTSIFFSLFCNNISHFYCRLFSAVLSKMNLKCFHLIICFP